MYGSTSDNADNSTSDNQQPFHPGNHQAAANRSDQQNQAVADECFVAHHGLLADASEASDEASDGEFKSCIDSCVSYSQLHQPLLGRGELLLSTAEAVQLNQVLASLYSDNCWVFDEIPAVNESKQSCITGRRSAPSSGGGGGGSHKSKRRSSLSGSQTVGAAAKESSKLRLTSQHRATHGLAQNDSSDDPILSPQLFHDIFHKNKESKVSYNNCNRTTKALLKHLKTSPHWVGCLHNVLLQLLLTTAAKPFARASDPFDFDYQQVTDSVQPRLTHIGLNTVLTKLQKGLYSTVLEAVNDIYSVWLCAYRIHPPGSSLWIQAHESSKTFFDLISGDAIKDDFSPTVTAAVTAAAGSSSGIGGSGSSGSSSGYEGSEALHSRKHSGIASSSQRVKRTSNTNVDKLFQEFLEQEHGKKTLSLLTAAGAAGGDGSQSKAGPDGLASSTGGKLPSVAAVAAAASAARKARKSSRSSSNSSSSRGGRKRVEASVVRQPIAEEERREFQEYLGLLQPYHHLMLYEAFRRSAVWRSIESGEVELDDSLTSSSVFHKMIIWCKTQVAVQNPNSSSDSQTEPRHQMNNSSSQGKGKIVPGVPDSAVESKSAVSRAAATGATAAPGESHIGLFSPKYSSTSSNTSSTSSLSSPSSSDDEGNDEDGSSSNSNSSSSSSSSSSFNSEMMGSMYV